jgi:hypothetical protein
VIITDISIPTSVWEAIGVVAVAIFGFFGALVKLLLAFRVDNKELQDKVMDRAIPALEANAEAGKQMVAATQQMLTALAVRQAVKNRDDDDGPPRRRSP